MSTSGARAAIYLRVSRDDQTTENQRLVLTKVVKHRGWLIVQSYEDHLSAGKGILKVAALVGVGSGTVQRVKREMTKQLVEAA